jgi:hypothetical protein
MGIAAVVAPREGEVERIPDALRAAGLPTAALPATRRVVRVDF